MVQRPEKPPLNGGAGGAGGVQGGVPVRRGMYRPVNRHGALQDMNQDNQVSFADTFLGDLLGFDGQVGTQGRPGMAASIGGARRGQQMPVDAGAGVPVDAGAVPVDPASAPIDDPTAPTPSPHPDVVQTDDTVTSDDVRDSTMWPVAGAAAAGAAGAVAARRIVRHGANVHPRHKDSVALTPDENGNVIVMRETNQGFRPESLPAQKAADGGWYVVGVNYDDGSNALPAPTGNSADEVAPGRNVTEGTGDSSVRTNQSANTANGTSNAIASSGTGSAQPVQSTGARSNAGQEAGNAASGAAPDTNNPGGQQRTAVSTGNGQTADAAGAGQQAVDPASAPIDTESVMTRDLPEGVREVPGSMDSERTGGGSVMVDTGERSPFGGMIFNDRTKGGYTTTLPDGRTINAATMPALRAALAGAL